LKHTHEFTFLSPVYRRLFLNGKGARGPLIQGNSNPYQMNRLNFARLTINNGLATRLHLWEIIGAGGSE